MYRYQAVLVRIRPIGNFYSYRFFYCKFLSEKYLTSNSGAFDVKILNKIFDFKTLKFLKIQF